MQHGIQYVVILELCTGYSQTENQSPSTITIILLLWFKESVNNQFIKRNLSNAITFAYKATQKETESHDTYHTKNLTHIDNVPCAIKIS